MTTTEDAAAKIGRRSTAVKVHKKYGFWLVDCLWHAHLGVTRPLLVEPYLENAQDVAQQHARGPCTENWRAHLRRQHWLNSLPIRWAPADSDLRGYRGP